MKTGQLITLGLAGIMTIGIYSMPVQAEETTGPATEQAGERSFWRERWENMTPEEREKHKAERQAMREKMKNMTPEERKAFWKQRMEEKLANMTPEERKAFEEHRAEMRKKFESMTPEERKAWREEHRRKWKEKQGAGV